MNVQLYDRAIASPVADQEALYRDLLLGSYDQTRDDTEKYVKKGGGGVGLEQLIAGKSPASAEALPKQVAEMEQVQR